MASPQPPPSLHPTHPRPHPPQPPHSAHPPHSASYPVSNRLPLPPPPPSVLPPTSSAAHHHSHSQVPPHQPHHQLGPAIPVSAATTPAASLPALAPATLPSVAHPPTIPGVPVPGLSGTGATNAPISSAASLLLHQYQQEARKEGEREFDAGVGERQRQQDVLLQRDGGMALARKRRKTRSAYVSRYAAKSYTKLLEDHVVREHRNAQNTRDSLAAEGERLARARALLDSVQNICDQLRGTKSSENANNSSNVVPSPASSRLQQAPPPPVSHAQLSPAPAPVAHSHPRSHPLPQVSASPLLPHLPPQQRQAPLHHQHRSLSHSHYPHHSHSQSLPLPTPALRMPVSLPAPPVPQMPPRSANLWHPITSMSAATSAGFGGGRSLGMMRPAWTMDALEHQHQTGTSTRHRETANRDGRGKEVVVSSVSGSELESEAVPVGPSRRSVLTTVQ